LTNKIEMIVSVKSLQQHSGRCRNKEMHDKNASGIGADPNGRRISSNDAAANVSSRKKPCSPSTGAISNASSLIMKYFVEMIGNVGRIRVSKIVNMSPGAKWKCLPQRIVENINARLPTKMPGTGHPNNMKRNVEPECEP